MRRLYIWTREKCLHLFSLKDRPHAVGLGVALGVFWGFTPIVGFKTLLAMGSARLFRGNVIAAAIAVTLHDLTLPFSPVLLRWEYQMGYWLLHHPHRLPPGIGSHLHLRAADWLQWKIIFTVGQPLLVGSLIIAVPLGFVSYWLALSYLKRREIAKTEEDSAAS